MTRDEAIKAFAGKMNHPMAEYYNETVSRVTPMIDGFVALGMLKLDETKPSPDARFSYAVARWVESGSRPGELPIYVSAAGLKIINSQ